MADRSLYTGTGFLEATGGTWDAEDAPWKAAQILGMLEAHDLHPSVIADVGCGSGVVLRELATSPRLSRTRFEGYDISPHAIALARAEVACERIRFHEGDPLDDTEPHVDLLLAIDVMEHVPDYLGFLRRCRLRADLKIYHVPLDIHVSSVLRNSFPRGRHTVGHLHYFVADTALDSLTDSGHEIIDVAYTDGAIALTPAHRSPRRRIADIARRMLARRSPALAARCFGGYSLLVLAR